MRFPLRTMRVAPAVLAVCGIAGGAVQAKTMFGESQMLGKGSVKTYAMTADDDRLTAVGIVFQAGMLEGLPPEPNKTSRCFDLNKNGHTNDPHECEGDYELRLAMPAALAKRTDVPYRWVGLNWNPHGHVPEAWSVPHFDFHFYMVDPPEIDGIRVGPCPIFINCEDKERALKKVPAKYVHHEHIDVGAAVSLMGNHLIDSKTPEMAKENPKPFTHTWIFGANDGHITFYEPMITRAYILSRPNRCHRIKQPDAWERAGYYPTVYCIRYSEKHATYTVSLEGMRYRKAE